jgi:hypothetical protein
MRKFAFGMSKIVRLRIGMIFMRWLPLLSVKLVEQELWQKEEKGLIRVLPVWDSEATAVGSF